MKALATLRSWLRGTFQRSRVEQEMDEELRFHIDSYTDDLVRAGLARAEARRRAGIAFGGVEARKEECRDALWFPLLDELVADSRYACRQLRRAPVFTAVAVLSLGWELEPTARSSARWKGRSGSQCRSTSLNASRGSRGYRVPAR